ncbi:MAG: hypothetical protein R3C14_24615 [Caldilineaceae bacterium]
MTGSGATQQRRVLLTPVAIHSDNEMLICIMIRDPTSEIIMAKTFTPLELAMRTDLPIQAAEAIFTAAQQAAHRYPLNL